MKNILLYIGRLWACLFSPKMAYYLSQISNYLYTGYYCAQFKKWGQRSLVKKRWSHLKGAECASRKMVGITDRLWLRHHLRKVNRVAYALSQKSIGTLMAIQGLAEELHKEIRDFGLQIITGRLAALQVHPILLLLPPVWWSNLLRRPHIFFFQVPTVELPHCRFPSGGTAMRWLRNAVCLLGCASCERTFGICRTSSRTGPHLLAFLASSSLASLPCEPGFFYQCGCRTPLHGFASYFPPFSFRQASLQHRSVPQLSLEFTAHHYVPCGFDWDSPDLLLVLRKPSFD